MSWQLPLVDLHAQHAALADELSDAVRGAFERGDWILGEDVAAFEDEFAAYCATRHAIGTDSGLSALELALRAFGIGPGDEVITAANTFVATALAISQAGATPVLVDVDSDTYAIEPSLVEEAVTARTQAIVPVHLYGQMADMDAILDVAARHGLLVIEDACQAHGARLWGRRAGSFGHAAAFSFYPSKNLGACGDGGIVVTSDDGAADAIRVLRNYGQREKYHHVVKGFNRRLDTLQAALLRVKLRRLDEWNAARRRYADLYERLLGDADVVAPVTAAGAEHVWHLYVVRVAERDALRSYLDRCGIATGIHYPVPVHLQAAYADLGYGAGAFPVSERYAGQIVSLPMYAELDEASVERVAGAVAEFASAGAGAAALAQGRP
jgi:dTDP-4-amino-4,6-dideoxygalactose transaminase